MEIKEWNGSQNDLMRIIQESVSRQADHNGSYYFQSGSGDL